LAIIDKIQKKKLWVASAILVAILAFGYFFSGPKDDSQNYSWDLVSQGEVRETITASGQVRAQRQSNIGTSTAGEIKEIHVKDGQFVQAGDLLVTIDNVRVSAQLEAIRKDAQRLKNQSERTGELFKKTEILYRQGLVSEEEYRNQKNNAEATALSYQASLKNIESAQDTVNKAILRAPFSGRITGLKAEKGDTAIPGMSNIAGALLMVISDMSHMQAEIMVNENEVVRIKVNQKAQVTIESLPGIVFQGIVEEVATGSEVNLTQGNLYKVKIGLEGSPDQLNQLRPGMSTRATILVASAPSVIRVPLQAVQERFGSPEEAQNMGLLSPTPKAIVMVYRDGRAYETPVVTGIFSTKFYEVKSGLALGDKVITGPSKKLKELKDRSKATLRRKSDSQIAEAMSTKDGKESPGFQIKVGN
jgi:HlyD family secretion protein